MPVTIGVKREYEFTGNDLNNDACIFPRDPRNHVFVQAFNFSTKKIASDPAKYLAFPFAVKLGSSIVGIYSDGDSHAASSKQIMFRSDDSGATYSTVTFYDSLTLQFDLSLLTGLLAVGESVVLKVFTVKNVAGTLTPYTTSTVSYGGLSYALWSRAYPATGGKLFRTGYATNGADTNAALFESSDGGVTWAGKAVMFATATRQYSEADIVNTSGTNWLAVCREDTGASNVLYTSTSTDDGATWSVPAALATTSINGRQPNLTKLSDGSIILATGDRSGSSGYAGSAGDQVTGFDTTGITIFRSTDAGATWSFRTRTSPIYSTDGGQPHVVETTAGRIAVIHYVRITTKTQPVIASELLDVANL